MINKNTRYVVVSDYNSDDPLGQASTYNSFRTLADANRYLGASGSKEEKIFSVKVEEITAKPKGEKVEDVDKWILEQDLKILVAKSKKRGHKIATPRIVDGMYNDVGVTCTKCKKTAVLRQNNGAPAFVTYYGGPFNVPCSGKKEKAYVGEYSCNNQVED